MSLSPTFAATPTLNRSRRALPQSSWDICRPSAARQLVLSADIAHQYRAIVLGNGPPTGGRSAAGEALQIAVPDPALSGLSALLASATFRPVVLVAAGDEEIAVAQAVCRDAGEGEHYRYRRLLSLADDLGLSHVLPLETRRTLQAGGAGDYGDEYRESRAFPVDEGFRPPSRARGQSSLGKRDKQPRSRAGTHDQPDSGLKPSSTVSVTESAVGNEAGTVEQVLAAAQEGWGPELLGLLLGLPHVTLSPAQLPAPLRLLLPPQLRSDRDGAKLAPWGVQDGVLLLACSGLPSEDILGAITAWSGYPVRCVLADPAVIRQAAQGSSPVRSVGSPRHARMDVRKASRLRQERRLQALSLQTGQPLDQLARRYLPGRKMAKPENLPYPAPEARGLLPRPLARSLCCLPLALDHEILELAVAEDDGDAERGPGSSSADIAAAVSLLTGYETRLRRFPAPALQRALLQMSLMPAQIAQSRAPGVLDVAGGTMTDVEVRAALYSLPCIRLEHYTAVTEAIATIPLAQLQTLHAVPLRREGQVLWVALAEPNEGVIRDLARQSGLTIRPLLATRQAIAERLETLAGMREMGRSQQRLDNPLLAHLQAARLITKAELLRLFRDAPSGRARSEEPLDQILEGAGILSFHQFCELAARVTGLLPVDLRLRRQEEEIVDALGQRTVRPVWHDPVDPAVSVALPADIMHRLALLPLRREGGHLLVAVADPFDPAIQAVLRDLEHEKPELVLAPRPAILTAIARISGHVPLGDLLLTHGMVTPQELARALQLARTAGVRLGQALLTLDLISQEQLAAVLAEQQHLPLFRLTGMEPDERVARLLPEEVERRLGVIPLYELHAQRPVTVVGEGFSPLPPYQQAPNGDDDPPSSVENGPRQSTSGRLQNAPTPSPTDSATPPPTLVVATPDPLNQPALDEVAARTERVVSPVVCTEDDFEAMLELLYRDEYLRISSSELVSRTPDESAAWVLSSGQKIALAITAALLLLLLVRAPTALGIAFSGVCAFFYVAVSLYRSYLIYHSLSHDLEIPVSDAEVAALKDENLPIYTILVPLYKEAAVLPTLLAGLTRLNYPATKLDVKLLLEEDDMETRAAVEAMRLPAYVHVVVVPEGGPRCKPKACNYGLLHARGQYVVIYDAEDVPDPDQLKKVVVAFGKSGEEMACLQAKLNYYNRHQNLLTAWFTNEYSMWFDLFLPGLDAANVPIPLGGTSNHFPTARLREIGAWDPYNVTEDADLGVRLYRRGWKTGVVDSTTLEEANSEVYNWIRQRSRWVKGYVQTYLVHMRHPLRLWQRLGTKAFLSFNMVVGGTFITFLLNPIFWCLTAVWYLSHAGFIRTIFPAPVFYLGTFSLVLGNFAFIYLNVAACLRRGHYGMVKFGLLAPLYWALMSVAAWKGFLQLWTNPFYWEKTTHGLYQRPGKRPEGETER